MSRRKRSAIGRTGKARSRREQGPPKPNKEHLAGMLDWLLPEDSIFSQMRLHGNTKWLPRCLVCLALCWGWSAARHLTDAFTEAEMFCQGLFQTFVLGTYQGFMGALTRWTPALMQILWPVLHQRMAEIGGRFWRIHGWVPIAFDGSRSRHHEPKPTSGPSVLRTTARGVPPSIARRRARACGEGTINGTSHSHKSRKPGSRCCGTWACACLGRGGWARRIPANALT